MAMKTDVQSLAKYSTAVMRRETLPSQKHLRLLVDLSFCGMRSSMIPYPSVGNFGILGQLHGSLAWFLRGSICIILGSIYT